jgi:hypothetical protein
MYTIEIPDKKRTLKIPSTWAELTYEQFLAAISLILLNTNRNVKPLAVKIEFLKSLVGFKEKSKQMNREDSLQVGSNLAIMSEALNFMYSEDEPNFFFRKFMSPDFKFAQAPFFEIQDTGADIIQTDITAEQFTDAWEYYNLYAVTNNMSNLSLLAAVLYAGNDYSPKRVSEIATHFEEAPEIVVYVIFLQFKSIIDYVQAHPVFGILFKKSGSSGDQDKITLGFGGSILSLAVKGYGSANEIAKKPFPDFLAMMIDLLKNDVSIMKAHEMKPSEIAKSLKLSASTVNKLL